MNKKIKQKNKTKKKSIFLLLILIIIAFCVMSKTNNSKINNIVKIATNSESKTEAPTQANATDNIANRDIWFM